MTGNNIGDEGVKSLSRTLKDNTTLTSLDLSREGKGKKNERKRKG